MFLGQAMEITETDCSKQYMLVEQFANFSKVGWFTAADPIYNLGDFFLMFFYRKDVAEYAQHFRCTPKKEYVNKII